MMLRLVKGRGGEAEVVKGDLFIYDERNKIDWDEAEKEAHSIF